MHVFIRWFICLTRLPFIHASLGCIRPIGNGMGGCMAWHGMAWLDVCMFVCISMHVCLYVCVWTDGQQWNLVGSGFRSSGSIHLHLTRGNGGS